jgi:putative radical SAM enzyme (TIGR03279 family)
VAEPIVSHVQVGSPAAKAGLAVGDTLVTINGVTPLDVIEYQQLIDGAHVSLVVRSSGASIGRKVAIAKEHGQPLGLKVDSAVFDRIRTCDNHCEFCFIYQLPKGMRPSLYLKDDDYRLSFLYGNFTTLTRFTELDAERVMEEGLSPLYVSIHASDSEVRGSLLRNRRGGTSLEWLDILLDAGIDVHGQVVVCPGVNDGEVLEQTLLDCLDRFGRLRSVGVVPLGTSDHSTEAAMRSHTPEEAAAVIDVVSRVGDASTRLFGERRIWASDEFYLVANMQLPALDFYENLTQVENGIGMWRSFEAEFQAGQALGFDHEGGGFFRSVDGAPPWGYRAERTSGLGGDAATEATILTGSYAAPLIQGLLDGSGCSALKVAVVENTFFGGNISVAGLMVGEDIARTIERLGAEHTYLIPDVALSENRFLDGLKVSDLPGTVQVIASEGSALRSLVDQLTGVTL